MFLMNVSEGVLLIALGAGYTVLYLAKKSEKNLKFLGYALGILILAIATISLVKNFIVDYHRNIRRLNSLKKQQVTIPPFPERQK